MPTDEDLPDDLLYTTPTRRDYLTVIGEALQDALVSRDREMWLQQAAVVLESFQRQGWVLTRKAQVDRIKAATPIIQEAMERVAEERFPTPVRIVVPPEDAMQVAMALAQKGLLREGGTEQ